MPSVAPEQRDSKSHSLAAPAQPTAAELEQRLQAKQAALEKADARIAHLKAELRAVIKAEAKKEDVADLLALVRQDCQEALMQRDALSQDLTLLLEERSLAEQRERIAQQQAERARLDADIGELEENAQSLMRDCVATLEEFRGRIDPLESTYRRLVGDWHKQRREGHPEFGRALLCLQASLNSLLSLLSE